MHPDAHAPRPQASPTLAEGRIYLSAVVGVPDDVASAVTRWRLDHAVTHAAPPHVTVFITELPDGRRDVGRVAETLRGACRGVGPVSLTLAGVGTFLPVSPVVFLNVTEGADRLSVLHRTCSAALPNASPFPYRPHLTLAHGEAVQDAESAVRDFGEFRCSFGIENLELFCGNLTGWEAVGKVSLLPDA